MMEIDDAGAAAVVATPSRQRRRSSFGGSAKKLDSDARVEAFFGMDPTRFIDDCCNTIDDYISDGLDVMESSVLKKSKGDVPKEVVIACINRLQAKYRSVSDVNFTKFEEYLRRNILDVPAWVAEEEEEANKPGNSTKEVVTRSPEETALDTELAEMEKQLEAVAAKKRTVKHEINEARARIRRGAQKYSNVASMLESTGLNEVDHLFSQAKALEPAVREGRQLLSTLAAAPRGGANENSGVYAKHGEFGLRGKSSLDDLQQLNSRILANLSNTSSSSSSSQANLK